MGGGMRSDLIKFLMQGDHDGECVEYSLDSKDSLQTVDETKLDGNAPSPRSPRTPLTFSELTAPDLQSFLRENNITSQDLQSLNQLLQQGFLKLNPNGLQTRQRNLVALTAMIVQLFKDEDLALDESTYELIQNTLTIFAMVSFVSGQQDNAGFFSAYFHPAEWILIYLHTHEEQELAAEALKNYVSFLNKISEDIDALRKKFALNTLHRCWLDNWYEMQLLQQCVLTGALLFDNPRAVSVIFHNQKITLMPFLRQPQANEKLIQLKLAMQIGEQLIWICPSNSNDIPQDAKSYLIQGDRFQEHFITELPLPMTLLSKTSCAQEDKILQNAWFLLITQHSLWFKMTKEADPTDELLHAYKAQSYHPYVVLSGQALCLLKEFLSCFDFSKASFYSKLASILSEKNPGKIKVYWMIALMRAVLGLSGVVMMLPLNYEETKVRQAYDLVQRFGDLCFDPEEVWCLNVSSCESHLEKWNEQAQEESSLIPHVFNDFWREALTFEADQQGVALYKQWIDSNHPKYVPSLDSSFNHHVTLFQYTQALQNCAMAALSYLKICASQYSLREKQLALTFFLECLIRYHYFTLCNSQGSKHPEERDASPSKDRGELYQDTIQKAFEWHNQHLRPGEDFFTRQHKDFSFFLELLNLLQRHKLFGQDNAQFFIFVSYLVAHFKPVYIADVNDSSQIARSYKGLSDLVWMKYQQGSDFLVKGYRTSLFGGIQITNTNEESDSVGHWFFLLLLYASGHSPKDVAHKNCHGVWLKCLSFYLIAVTLAQWAMLRIPISGDVVNTSKNKQLYTHHLRGAQFQDFSFNSTTALPIVSPNLTMSDIIFVGMALLALARSFDNFGGCEKVLRHPLAQGIVAGLYIVTAIALQPVGFYLLDKNPNDINATTYLVFGNSILFVMASGVPFKFAEQSSKMLSWIFPESPLRFFYEMGLAIGRCHREEKKTLVRLHIQHVSNRILYAVFIASALSVACLNCPSFLANLVGNFPGNYSNEYGQDISFAGVSGAIVVPSAVFFSLLLKSPEFKWFKAMGEISQPGEDLKTHLGFSDWIELGLMIAVAAGVGLFLWKEGQFLVYQHQNNETMLSDNSTFMSDKENIESGSIAVSIVCFITWVIMDAYKNAEKSPYLGSPKPPLDRLSCCSRINHRKHLQKVGVAESLVKPKSHYGTF